MRRVVRGVMAATVLAAALAAMGTEIMRCQWDTYVAVYGPLASFVWWLDGCPSPPAGGGGSGAS